MTAPVFVVEHFRAGGGGRYVLDGPEGRHAVSVKRLRPGEDVVLTDGAGRWAECVVVDTEGKDRLIVHMDSTSEEPAPEPRVTVVQALPKGDRGELAVETMTEVGVDAIVPWAAARCVTQWKGERGGKALAKWRATAREAGKQSRRVRFPEVADAATGRQVAELLAGGRLRRRPARERRRAAGRGRTAHRGRDRAGRRPGRGRVPGGVVPLRPGRGARLPPGADRAAHLHGRHAAAALLLGRTGRWS
ncbi:hypothetical protein GCM10020295_55550 [Streptomyces cinereospinus]